MSILTLTERLKQYPNPFVKGVLRTVDATERNLFGTFPWTIHDDGETINSSASNVTSYWAERDGVYTNGGSSTVNVKTVAFKHIYGQFDISEFDSVRDPEVVMNEAISASAEIGVSIRNGIYNGTGASGQMNSMRTETVIGQTISDGAVDPTNIAFRTALNQLVRKVGRCDVIVMPVAILDKYDRMLYTNNGGNTNWEMKTDMNAATLSSFNGIPVIGLQVDVPQETVTGTSDSTGLYGSVYAVQFAGSNGDKKGCSFVAPNLTAYNGENFGIGVKRLGQQHNGTNYTTNDSYKVGMFMDFQARNQEAIARLVGVTL
jgi:hypothetical protein